MNIDTEHLHHWIQAIRKSSDPMRTMDAFWQGQLKSKEWLITHLTNYIPMKPTIEIHGGWIGVLASMLFQTLELDIQSITSVDIDADCQPLAEEVNRIEYHQNRFRAETGNMCIRNPATDVVINTSCEHISQLQYDTWLTNMRKNQLLVLQSNNYSIEEHIRTTSSLDEFKEQSQLSVIYFSGELQLAKYTRFMLIGRK